MLADGVTIVELRLPNGATALVAATDVEGGAVKTGFADAFDSTDLVRALEGVSDLVKSALTKAAPHKATVTLGIELAVKAGKLTGLIMGAEGKGALTVTLEWNFGGAAAPG